MRHFIAFIVLALLVMLSGIGFAQGNGDAGKDKGATGEVALEIAESEHGWTIHAVSIDAHELLTTFAAQAHLQLIVDDALKRRITINIVDKPPLEVLKVIVDAYGFAWAEVDGMHILSEGMPRSPSSYLLSDIASVTTKYVTPSQAWSLLPTFLQGEVKINTDQNAVILSGPTPVLEKFRQDVARFDIPAAQIMLNVDVVEFTNMDTDTFSAMLSYGNAHIGISTDSLTGESTLTALTMLPTNFTARLQALVEEQRARVRANPRIATVSGRGANIFIGQQQYLTNPVYIPGRGSSYSIDAGVSLSITPLTGGGGEIILDLSEEISTLSAPDTVTGLPTKTTRSASSTIRVRDGQTIVIGGLRQAEDRSTRRAIPILSKLPLVGSFFRSKKIESTMVDLAIFITARTLSQTGHLPGVEEDELMLRMGVEEKPAP
jgi:type IV pilus assembly protein PilQ